MDDVLAVMDAAGSERAAIAGTLEGGPMAAMFAATHPDRVERAWSSTRPSRAPPGRPDYDWAWTAEERDEARWPSWSSTGARAGGRRGRARAAWATRLSWSGRAGSSGWRRARRPIRRDLRADRRVRRARRAALDPRAHARAPPPRRPLHQGRALALHGRAHPGRAATSSSRAIENMFSVGRHRGDARRDRGVPHRRAATSASPTGCSRRCCSPTSAARPSAPPRWATAAGASCSSATTSCSGGRSRATAAARSSAPATASSPPSTARRARSAAPPRGRARWARWASRCGPGCTPASWR